MKTKLILGSFLVFSAIMNAQTWGGSAVTTGNTYRSGNVGIGTTSPAYLLDIVAGTGAQGIKINQTGSGSSALHLHNATSGGKNWSMYSLGSGDGWTGPGGFAIANSGTSAQFVINGTTGNVGIGLNTGVGPNNPTEKLSVSTSTANDGISITQTTGGASALHMYNTSSGGNHWALFSTGSGNGQGSGNFSIFQYGAADRLFIKGSTGNVGIGTISPGYKLHVESDDVNMANNPFDYYDLDITPSYQTTYSKFICSTKLGVSAGIYGHDINNAQTESLEYLVAGIGVFGKAERTVAQQPLFGLNVGVYGYAVGTTWNIGGIFNGDGGVVTQSSKSSGNEVPSGQAFGIWANTSDESGISGYFNGSSYSSSYYQAADEQLKKEVKPITNALDKLKLFKPNTFVFDIEKKQNMNLPQGKQMGLTAQDLEKDFPELIKEVVDLSDQLKHGKANEFNSYKIINYTNLIPLLIAGMQEQQKQIEDQAKANEELKNLVAMQQQQMEDLVAKGSNLTGISSLNGQVDNFGMEQNVPNPFSNETVIKYNLPQSIVKAKMNIYDLSGKQIASFPLDIKGNSSLTITSEKLSAGIYIYSIIADGKVMDSKRMVVAEKE